MKSFSLLTRVFQMVFPYPSLFVVVGVVVGVVEKDTMRGGGGWEWDVARTQVAGGEFFEVGGGGAKKKTCRCVFEWRKKKKQTRS